MHGHRLSGANSGKDVSNKASIDRFHPSLTTALQMDVWVYDHPCIVMSFYKHQSKGQIVQVARYVLLKLLFPLSLPKRTLPTSKGFASKSIFGSSLSTVVFSQRHSV